MRNFHPSNFKCDPFVLTNFLLSTFKNLSPCQNAYLYLYNVYSFIVLLFLLISYLIHLIFPSTNLRTIVPDTYL